MGGLYDWVLCDGGAFVMVVLCVQAMCLGIRFIPGDPIWGWIMHWVPNAVRHVLGGRGLPLCCHQ